MARSVDDVDLMFPPVAGGSGRSNCNAPVLFLLEVVHCGFAVVDFAYLVVFACIVKDTFCSSRFSGINVCHDSYISYFFFAHGQKA